MIYESYINNLSNFTRLLTFVMNQILTSESLIRQALYPFCVRTTPVYTPRTLTNLIAISNISRVIPFHVSNQICHSLRRHKICPHYNHKFITQIKFLLSVTTLFEVLPPFYPDHHPTLIFVLNPHHRLHHLPRSGQGGV